MEPAPSQMPEADAGVTTPPFLKGVGSLASFSIEVCGLGCSSVSKTSSPFLPLSVIGASSSANLPAACAAAHFCCDETA